MTDQGINTSAPENRQAWPCWALDELRGIAVEMALKWAPPDSIDAVSAKVCADAAELLMRTLYPGLP